MNKIESELQSAQSNKPNDLALAPAEPDSNRGESEKAGCQQRPCSGLINASDERIRAAQRLRTEHELNKVKNWFNRLSESDQSRVCQAWRQERAEYQKTSEEVDRILCDK